MLKKTMKLALEEGNGRRVPLALVLAILLQAATAIWWAAGKERDLFFLSERVRGLETSLADFSKSLNRISDRLARIEERQEAQLRFLEQIEKQSRR
jgi:predicted trehalose synthase